MAENSHNFRKIRQAISLVLMKMRVKLIQRGIAFNNHFLPNKIERFGT
jgi:hypothetical protein